MVNNHGEYMGMSENGVNIPNEIAIFSRDNDQQNHWVQWGTRHFQTNPIMFGWNNLRNSMSIYLAYF